MRKCNRAGLLLRSEVMPRRHNQGRDHVETCKLIPHMRMNRFVAIFTLTLQDLNLSTSLHEKAAQYGEHAALCP